MNAEQLNKLSKKILKAIDRASDKAARDRRSTAAYWNADDWGSISGVRDAIEWVKQQKIKAISAAISAAIKRERGEHE